MKKKKFISSLGNVDEKYISEANPENFSSARPKKRMWQVLVAACIVISLLLTSLFVFIPLMREPRDKIRSEYGTKPELDSEHKDYLPLAEKLNEYIELIKQDNSSNKGDVDFEIEETPDAGAPDAAPPTGGDMNGSTDSSPDVDYEAATESGTADDITDNQVEGVAEADRIKRSDKHIFYMYDKTLEIFTIDKENTKKISSYKVDVNTNGSWFSGWDFYLSDDYKTVTVIAPYRSTDGNSCVELISLDVSDPANVQRKNSFVIMGGLVSTRLTNDTLLLISEYVINTSDIDINDPETYIPKIDTGNGFISLPASDIYLPEDVTHTRYTIVTKLDASTLSHHDSKALLSYTDDIYVTAEDIYLFNVYADIRESTEQELSANGFENNSSAEYMTRNSMTNIVCLSYGGNEIVKTGSINVRGYVKDQYSLDEYNGILRVVTTTNATVRRKEYMSSAYDNLYSLQIASGRSNASLYCIDLQSWEITGSVIDFAPPHEEVQSVRFDKENAYVCTSIERSDPVFFFDLSDIHAITYKDTGTIEGYSTSLVNLGDGYLLGIGTGSSWSSLKIEVYEETEDGVRSVDSYELFDVYYSEDYKSYYINRELDIVGLGIGDYAYGTKYTVLQFDGYVIREILSETLEGDCRFMRGVLIDGYYYMFGMDQFKVIKII